MNKIIRTWNTTTIMRTRKNTNFAITCTSGTQNPLCRIFIIQKDTISLFMKTVHTKTVHTSYKTKTVHAYKNYPSWTTLSELETLHQLSELERTQMNNIIMNNIIKNTHKQHYQNLKHYINYANSKELSLMNNIIRTWNTTSIMRTRKNTNEQHYQNSWTTLSWTTLSRTLMNNIIRTWNTTSIMRTRKNGG